MKERRVAVGPDEFPYVTAGAGEPVLFVHGAPGDHRSWQRHFAALADCCRCIAYTQRWFGSFAWRPDGAPFGSQTHADDLIAVVSALGLGPPALVAFSYGGHPALTAAVARPDLFSRLLVFEPGVPTYVEDPAELARFEADAPLAYGPIFAAAQAGDDRLAVRRMVEMSGDPGAFERQDEAQQRIQLDSAAMVPRLLAQPPPPSVSCRDLAELEVPVTIVWGSASRPVFTVPSRAAAKCIGGDRHIEVPGADHLWPLDRPEAFAALVAEWLARP